MTYKKSKSTVKSFISLTFEGHLYYTVTVEEHGRVTHLSTTATKCEEC